MIDNYTGSTNMNLVSLLKMSIAQAEFGWNCSMCGNDLDYCTCGIIVMPSEVDYDCYKVIFTENGYELVYCASGIECGEENGNGCTPVRCEPLCM